MDISQTNAYSTSDVDTTQLNDAVKEYMKLNHEKRKLLKSMSIIRTRIKELEPQVEEFIDSCGVETVPFVPTSSEDEVIMGGSGTLCRKYKNVYDTMTKQNISLLGKKFFETVYKGLGPVETTQMGHVLQEFFWANRGRKPINYLERSYAEDKVNKSRKAAASYENGEKPKKTKVDTTPAISMEKFSTLINDTTMDLETLTSD